MDLRQGKVVVSHGSKQAHSQSKGSRDHITVNCAISAAGSALPPMIIFEKSFPSSAYVTQGPINTHYAKSPHTTHLLQPLDILVYKPLKNHFSTITDFIVLASVTHGPTKIMVNKTNFPILFKEAFEKTMSMKTIISGFHTSGICPFNPEAILKERLMPSDDATGIVNQVQQATP